LGIATAQVKPLVRVPQKPGQGPQIDLGIETVKGHLCMTRDCIDSFAERNRSAF
jgi:hypothetical protein